MLFSRINLLFILVILWNLFAITSHPYPWTRKKNWVHLCLQSLQQSIQLKCFWETTCGSCISHISVSTTGPMVLKMKWKGSQFMINLIGFLKWLHSDFSSATLPFYLLFLIWPQLSTPPPKVILYMKPSRQPRALRESGCVQNPR